MKILGQKSFCRFLILTCIACLSLFISACGNDREEQIRDNFKTIVDQLNQSTPLQIDALTVLDKLSLGSGAHIIHHYSIDTFSIEQESANPKDVVSAMQQMLIPLICENNDTKAVIEFGAKFEYIYSDSQGNEFASYIIDKSDCQK